MARDLHAKHILITGGGTGIGAAVAVQAATLGMDVTLAGRRREPLVDIADRIETFGRRAHVVTCDVNDDQAVQAMLASSWEAFGRLDAVFANAGYGLFKSVLETSEAEVRAIFETNFYGTLRVVKAAVPELERTADGLKHILICSSSASEVGVPMMGAYCATKAAQDSIAGALRAELHDRGFSVTSVHPVATRTDFFDSANDRSATDSTPTANGAATSDETAKPTVAKIAVDMNTPKWFVQDPKRVATWVGRALLRPRPEVWPSSSARWLMAMGTALPRIPAWLMRRHQNKIVTK